VGDLVSKKGIERINFSLINQVKGGGVELSSGKLNPEWVEWLMGWPIGHTALEDAETA
jgi:hypothetical protein